MIHLVGGFLLDTSGQHLYIAAPFPSCKLHPQLSSVERSLAIFSLNILPEYLGEPP
jgi:hypothetical protein